MLPTSYKSFLALFLLSFSRIKEFRHENPCSLTPGARLAFPFANRRGAEWAELRLLSL